MINVDERLKALCAVANDFFTNALEKSDEACSYLDSRGITIDDVNGFNIGYCHQGFVQYFTYNRIIERLLPFYNNAEGLTKKDEFVEVLHGDLKKIGLLGENDERKYPVLNDRVIFPIRDELGDIVSFAGRLIKERDSAKYINGKTSPIYEKTDTIYGLDRIAAIKKKMRFIPVNEGYLDVIALGRVGLLSVAVCGTACTKEHIQTLFNHTDTVVLCLDGDKAGIEAAIKAAITALPYLNNERTVKVKFLDAGQDPDSIITDGLNTLSRDEVRRHFTQNLLDCHSLVDILVRAAETECPGNEAKQNVVLASYAMKAPMDSAVRAEIVDRIMLREIKAEKIDLKEATSVVAEASRAELQVRP
ncbi:toprim domain-containing protein [Vibrio parahaemolyticus]|uniref:toprim domain-containing protein n=1 Tax=Vibrio parahaemolyticus TaxID=670 RepID=UPI000813C733|nr:toprim domain-containing protein [Vibrio parahaemolyticus]OCP68416.1 hypothetical protein AKH08_16530 [Vibrio parahaemolyticus]